LFLAALRASGGTGAHAEAARRVVLTILLAQALAAGAFEASAVEASAAPRPPRRDRPRRERLPQHGSLAGRRPRG
jgi:predicted component of type VI protein secretion system